MQLSECRWPEVGGLTSKVVVAPIGSMEQHGHHLPLMTDSMIGAEVARRAAEELGDDALFLPMLWLGASDHHLTFPGTVSVSNEVYVRMVSAMLDSLIVGGFRRILLLNSHGGNILPGGQAMYDVQLRRRTEHPDLRIAFASWFSLLQGDDLERIVGLKQRKVIHACEWETSAIMAIRPELVGDDRPAAQDPGTSAFWVADYSRSSRIDVARAIDEGSATGAFGWPELASAEKGEALMALAAREVVALVREMAGWPGPESGG